MYAISCAFSEFFYWALLTQSWDPLSGTGRRCSDEAVIIRGGKIGPARWASPVRPKLGPGWAIKILARKKPGQIWPGPVWPSPVWPGPVRSARFFFALKRLFGPTGPVFRAGWTVKILARKNRANFGPARFWPGPLLARPSSARPARLPPLVIMKEADVWP